MARDEAAKCAGVNEAGEDAGWNVSSSVSSSDERSAGVELGLWVGAGWGARVKVSSRCSGMGVMLAGL